MKLALALSERADIQKKINDLGIRLNRNAKVQEGETPTEDPIELISEMEGLYERLEDLISRINRTNNETKCGDVTMTDLLAKRDCLKARINRLRSFLDNASNLTGRYYSKSEIKTYSTVSVVQMQKKVDALSKEFRELDEKIQETNWTTELI
jgi:hypothetical protein